MKHLALYASAANRRLAGGFRSKRRDLSCRKRQRGVPSAWFFGVLSWCTVVHAADAPQVTARFGVHDDFDRVAIGLPAGTGYSSSQSGSILTLQLNGAGQVTPPNQAGHRVLGMHGGKSVFLIRMAPGTHAHIFRVSNRLVIDVSAGAAPASQADQQAAAAAPAKSDHTLGSGKKASELPVSTKSARLANGTITLSPKHLSASAVGNLETLRQELAQKLEALNAPAPADIRPPQTSESAGVAQLASAAATPPRQVCRPSFDMTSWQGGDFIERRAQLRARIAGSHAARASLAALAEFYLGHGLAAEALDAAGEGLADGSTPRSQNDDATRLQRDADLARLMKGVQIAAASPLLADAAACERPDLPLWQALAAAAAHDPAGVDRAMAKAQVALRALPEPVRPILAYRLADAVEDGATALPLIAAALRNTEPENQEDRAAALLLDARLASAKGQRDEAAKLLAKAAGTGRSLPALQAKVRLAEMAARADGPLSARDEASLSDFARVYRDNALGQGAAAELAERKLRENDFPAALAIADQSAHGGGRQRVSDRGGAAQISRILRTLLVSPGQARLPPPAQRAALFLRYQGYATPGPQGDDIRLGAAQLLLAQGLPQAALDAARQIAGPAVAAPPGLTTLATAEAQGGDPAKALDLLGHAPSDDDLRRIAALALARLGRPAEAAHALDGMTALPDRLQRARLLATAKSWTEAAAAYAELLHDPDLKGETRSEASDRYGLAIVLAGAHPDPGLALPDNGLAAHALAALPTQPTAQPAATADAPGTPAPGGSGHAAIAAVRDALQRARAIDTLLPSANSNQGA
jgi:hypothetical protein